MKTKDLLKEIAFDVEMPVSKVKPIYDAVIKNICASLQGGESITIKGFGTFKVVERKAKKGVNPKTGEKINIPASKTVKFKVSKSFKELLN